MSHDDRPGDSSGPMTWPRHTGTPTFMRTPFAEALDDVDAGLTGAPFDGGVTNRHGPHGIRNRSSLMRHFNRATKVAPHDLCRVCDVWDTPIRSPFHLKSSLDEIEQAFARLHEAGVVPVAAGGDHSITLPVFRTIAKHRPVGVAWRRRPMPRLRRTGRSRVDRG